MLYSMFIMRCVESNLIREDLFDTVIQPRFDLCWLFVDKRKNKVFEQHFEQQNAILFVSQLCTS